MKRLAPLALAALLALAAGIFLSLQGAQDGPAPNTAVGGNETGPPPGRQGLLEENETWSGSVLVSGDVIVAEGATLTLLPGVSVTVAANSDGADLYDEPCGGVQGFDSLRGINTDPAFESECGVSVGEPFRDEGNHVSIIVLGTLNATGTPEGPITIKSNASSPGIYDWNRFVISNGVLSNARIENYRILETLGDVEIRGCELKDVGECGVCASSDSARIISNEISYAGHELIGTFHTSPRIEGNTLGPNPSHAGIVVDGGDPIIVGNSFIASNLHFIGADDFSEGALVARNEFDAQSELLLGCAMPEVRGNNILWRVSTLADGNCASPAINLSENYWGTNDSQEIEGRIFHQKDDKTLRRVIYLPFMNREADVPAS